MVSDVAGSQADARNEGSRTITWLNTQLVPTDIFGYEAAEASQRKGPFAPDHSASVQPLLTSTSHQPGRHCSTGGTAAPHLVMRVFQALQQLGRCLLNVPGRVQVRCLAAVCHPSSCAQRLCHGCQQLHLQAQEHSSRGAASITPCSVGSIAVPHCQPLHNTVCWQGSVRQAHPRLPISATGVVPNQDGCESAGAL
ncbi:hypothetical protein HaLaN_02690 [Haematococcus lacustris]|uniref:Uncharacterized protein n=1 Tax=Haematococcus lacustris TaxID=44745 RepID=A0A699YCA8_HAELA|nr:hypothetical protein HaLaN_02690 [Haematococcus lacustris]